MVEHTPNHGLHRYERGETNWSHAPDMATIEERLVVRDREEALASYEPHEGAIFVATDTGAVYDGDGSTWHPAARGFDAVRAGAVNNEVNVRGIEGETLAERVERALERIEGGGVIRIPRPPGGGAWRWGETLTIVSPEHEAIELRFDRGVIVEYDGDGWAIDVDGRDAGQRNSVAIVGEMAEFVSTGANPQGFLRATDQYRLTVRVNSRGFRNEAGNGTAVKIRNQEKFSEKWELANCDHRVCDVGLDFETAAMTGGSAGTTSFADGHLYNVTFHFYEIGARFRGGVRTMNALNTAWFPRKSGSAAIVIDGRVDNAVFVGPRFDTTGGLSVDDSGKDSETEANDAEGVTDAFRFGPNSSAGGGPIVIGPHYSGDEIVPVRKHEPEDDIWTMDALAHDGSLQIGNLGEGYVTISRTGAVRIYDEEGRERAHVSNSGHVEDWGDFRTGEAIGFQDGVNVGTVDDTPSIVPWVGGWSLFTDEADGKLKAVNEAGDVYAIELTEE